MFHQAEEEAAEGVWSFAASDQVRELREVVWGRHGAMRRAH